MGGGKAIRRRAKLMERANQGNLHKATKRRASAHLPLPPAPGKDDYKEKVPASLAKLMALKEALSRPAKRQKQEPTATPSRQSTKQLSMGQLPGEQEQQNQQQQQPQPQLTRPADSHSGGKQPFNTRAELTRAKPTLTGTFPEYAAVNNTAAANTGKPAALLWEQPKKLKQRRKDYLNAKKLKKKAGRKGLSNQDVLPVDKPAFGEVVHEPPKVQLKRKHWDPVAAAAEAAEAEAPGKSSSSHSKQKQQQQQQRQQGKKPPKKRVKQDSAMMELREQVIEEYRAGRGPREGHATLGTLKKLVQ